MVGEVSTPIRQFLHSPCSTPHATQLTPSATRSALPTSTTVCLTLRPPLPPSRIYPPWHASVSSLHSRMPCPRGAQHRIRCGYCASWPHTEEYEVDEGPGMEKTGEGEMSCRADSEYVLVAEGVGVACTMCFKSSRS